MLAGLDFLVEVLDQVIDLGRRLVIGRFLLEIKDNVGALGDVLVGEEGVEEVLELHQALLQELLAHVSEGFLLREIREPIVRLHVKLLLDEGLELAHGRVPVPDVERDVARRHHLYEVLGVAPVGLVLHELYLVGVLASLHIL